jgi:hypothetical protein
MCTSHFKTKNTPKTNKANSCEGSGIHQADLLINPSRNFCSNPPKMYLSLLCSASQQELNISLSVFQRSKWVFLSTKAADEAHEFSIYRIPSTLAADEAREFGAVSLFASGGRVQHACALSVDVSRLYPSHSALRVCVPRGATDMPLFRIISNPRSRKYARRSHIIVIIESRGHVTACALELHLQTKIRWRKNVTDPLRKASRSRTQNAIAPSSLRKIF